MADKIRTGARTFLFILAKSCKLSHTPGFRIGLNQILGVEVVTNFYTVWSPLCEFVDLLVEGDNWYNQRDYKEDDGPGEDQLPPVVG